MLSVYRAGQVLETELTLGYPITRRQRRNEHPGYLTRCPSRPSFRVQNRRRSRRRHYLGRLGTFRRLWKTHRGPSPKSDAGPGSSRSFKTLYLWPLWEEEENRSGIPNGPALHINSGHRFPSFSHPRDVTSSSLISAERTPVGLPSSQKLSDDRINLPLIHGEFQTK